VLRVTRGRRSRYEINRAAADESRRAQIDVAGQLDHCVACPKRWVSRIGEFGNRVGPVGDNRPRVVAVRRDRAVGGISLEIERQAVCAGLARLIDRQVETRERARCRSGRKRPDRSAFVPP
jgi:hypothetical protein